PARRCSRARRLAGPRAVAAALRERRPSSDAGGSELASAGHAASQISLATHVGSRSHRGRGASRQPGRAPRTDGAWAASSSATPRWVAVSPRAGSFSPTGELRGPTGRGRRAHRRPTLGRGLTEGGELLADRGAPRTDG